jgi:hypothetical protein
MDTGVILSDAVEYTKEAFSGKWARWLIFVILNLPIALFPFIFDPRKIIDQETAAVHWELIHWDQIAMIMALSILFSFFLSGYMVRVYRGVKPAPDFGDWGRVLIDGLRLQIVGFAWFLPVFIVVIFAVALVIFTTGSAGSGSLFLLLLLLVLLIAGIILLVLVALLSVMGIIRFARTGSMAEGLRYSAIMELIGKVGWGNYIVALIVLIVVGFAFGIIIMVLSFIPFAGWIANPVLTPLLTVFSARYYTLIYDMGTAQPVAVVAP